MSFEFVLPVNRDDLLQKTGVNQYVVDEVLAIKSLASKLKESQMAFRSGGPLVILTHFDTFFSVIVHFNGIDGETKESAWRLILMIVQGLGGTLADFVEQQNVTGGNKQEQLNALKMSAYVLCQMMERWELSNIEPSNTISITTGRGKKKVIKSTQRAGDHDRIELMANWDGEREKAVKALLQIFQLSISRLWDPPIVEEEFVNMVTNQCYRLLETPNVVKNKSLRESIFHLLGLAVKRYNHSMGCTLKLLQLLQQNEQLAPPCAAAIQLFVDSYGIRGIVSEIMREIGRMDGKELARDTSGTKAYAAFLLELSRCVPASVLPNISIILVLLDEESYTMRNGVLGVIGELIVKLLSGEGLDTKQKFTRDQLLDKLEDHIHDVNAFVRSRVLQIWLYIVSENALPLPKQLALLKLTIGRLQDKSSVVRKSAIQLLSALLRINILAARLTAEELGKNYEQELAKLREMAPDVVSTVSNTDLAGSDGAHAEKLKSVLEEWKNLEDKLTQFFTKSAKTSQNDEETSDNDDENNEGDSDSDESGDVIIEEETEEEVISRLVQLLKDGRFRRATALLKAASDQWPLDPCFQGNQATLPIGLEEDGEESSSGKLNTEDLGVLNGLKSVFLVHSMESVLNAEQQADNAAPLATQATADNSTVVTAVSKQQVLVQFLKDSVEFVTEIEKGVGVVCQLLSSKTATDVLEAIDFFVSGVEAGVGSCRLGVRRLLPLVWSKETSIKEAVTDAYKRVYLSAQSLGQHHANNARAQAVSTANSLISLTSGNTTLGDLTSLEELIKQFVKGGELGNKVIQVLWEKFALKLPNTGAEESRGALVLLGMVAAAQPETVKSNITTLISEGLGERGEQNYLLARDTCVAFSKLAVQSKSERPFRFKKDHELFLRLTELLVSGLPNTDSSYYIPLAEEAVSLIYKLAENPDVICAEIIKKQAMSIVGLSTGGGSKDTSDVLDLITDDASTNENASSVDPKTSHSAGLPSPILTRFLFLCGHVAFKQLLHLDVAIFGEMKRRHALQENNGELRNNGNNGKGKSGGASVAASAVKQAKEATAEEEMGLAGATAEDAEAEYIRKIAETELVTGGSNLLSVLSPLVLAVCTNQSRFSDPDLRTAASLALYKYMTVSSEFCETHLPLLFTLLEKSAQPSVKANTIIALGDLTFRFPNLIEPWTPNMYAKLRDTSILVRKHTLTVLTHLILRDMIKVKGQISEMAICVIDDDIQISGLAKLFFLEFSKKGNAIYNILPDVISRLSDTEVGVEEENFRVILKYLMSFIQKDRQCESLVEKLCHRFRVTCIERQWRDLAYCLSLLQYNDKSIRKLQENFCCFGDKLVEDFVYDSFVAVIASARKLSKPESKVLLDEFEQRIEEARTKGVDDGDTATNAAAAAGAKSCRKPAEARRQKAGKKKLELTSSSDDDDMENDESVATTKQPTAGARAASNRSAAVASRSKARPVFDLTSDEDEDFAVAKASTTAATKRGASERSKRAVVSNSSDEDIEESPPSVIKVTKSVCNRTNAKSGTTSRTARKK